jgi:CheY-like chemotaxis protein
MLPGRAVTRLWQAPGTLRPGKPGEPMHVLVVHHDPDLREALRWMLEDKGYVVSTAADNRAALAFLRVHAQPLVVLLDQEMPGMRGTDLLEASLHLPWAPRAFILLTTAPDRVPAPFNRRAMQRLVPVVALPFEMDALFALVASAAASLDDAETGERQASVHRTRCGSGFRCSPERTRREHRCSGQRTPRHHRQQEHPCRS